jgi:hypothetical protein
MRSIWKEMSFFAFVIQSNLVSLKNVANEFGAICSLFLVEKRVKTRNLQLQI